MINVSEKDFEALVQAAFLAEDMGNRMLADHLDKLARKVNASLTRRANPKTFLTRNAKSFTWRDAPSVFEGIERK